MNIIQAKQAIDYFEGTKFKDIKNSAAYEIQQACEKLIKIQIYSDSYKASTLRFDALFLIFT